MPVFACAEVNGHKIEAKVMNPGDWFGKVWLVEIGCGISSFYFAVEADTFDKAVDEFCDSEAGHHIHINELELDDYKVETDNGFFNLRGEKLSKEQADKLMEPNYLGNSGTPCDLDHFLMREFDGCVYFDKDDEDCKNIPPALYPERELRFEIVDQEDFHVKSNFRTEREAHDWIKAHDFHEPLYIQEQEKHDTVVDHGGEG